MSSTNTEIWTNEKIIENPPHVIKKAVFVGINYPGTSLSLRGCIQDALLKFDYIKDKFGPRDNSNTIFLMDDTYEVEKLNPFVAQNFKIELPTNENLKKALYWLTRDNEPGDFVLWHSSSHGSQSKDDNGDEQDGEDECICPCDCDKVGYIRDDFIRQRIDDMPAGSLFYADFDSCHSASIADLPELASINEQTATQMIQVLAPPVIHAPPQPMVRLNPQQQQQQMIIPMPQNHFQKDNLEIEMQKHRYWVKHGLISNLVHWKDLIGKEHILYYSRHDAGLGDPHNLGNVALQLARQRSNKVWIQALSDIPKEKRQLGFDRQNLPIVYTPLTYGYRNGEAACLFLEKCIEPDQAVPNQEERQKLSRQRSLAFASSPMFNSQQQMIIQPRMLPQQQYFIPPEPLFYPQPMQRMIVTRPMTAAPLLRTQSTPFQIQQSFARKSFSKRELKESVNIKISGNYKECKCVAIVFSGCLDKGTSADAHINGKNMGAMTWAHLESLNNMECNTIMKILISERNTLKKNNYEQIPQASFGNNGSKLLNAVHPLHISRKL